MTHVSRASIRLVALYAALAATAAVAQDSMPGMDGPHTHHSAPSPNGPAAAKHPRPGQVRAQKASAPEVPGAGTASPASLERTNVEHANHAGAMHGTAMGPVPPPSNATGTVQVLDIGSQIGIRPVVRGLDLAPMEADEHGMPMHGGNAPPDARSADYSDGAAHGSMTGMDMLDDAALGMLLVDQLESFDGRNGNGAFLDAEGWYGSDANKFWVKAEGERSTGQLQDLRIEALWAHPAGAYWDTQAGVRRDFGVGPDRTWAAFGIQGLAPYWFEVEATLYIGQAGRTALRFESEYELLLTQRLILQPRLEVNLYGRDDPQHGIGSGLSDAEFGLRLRYEFTRKFAPYAGVDFGRTFGRTADLARRAGEPVFGPRLVAGLRFWF